MALSISSVAMAAQPNGNSSLNSSNRAKEVANPNSAVQRVHPVYFPDTNLDLAIRAEIKNETGKTIPVGEDILNTDVKGLTFLDASGQGIKDISGLEELINLQSLVLYNNQISSIKALSKLTNLQYLNLGRNQISDIKALSNLIDLQYLYLSYNQISDTDKQKLKEALPGCYIY
jgi:Leucine-rich repeat (LRR) protein